MTLDEAITYTEKVAEENQRVVDTGIVFNDVTIDMLYCDDTEVIEKHLAYYQKCAEEHRQLAEWLKDYKRLLEQETKIGYCKDCKWWKDSDGVYRRGIGTESQCPINDGMVYEGNGYCYRFKPQEGSREE